MAKNPDLDVQHLHSNVWTPAFQQCQSLLENLYEQTITLGDVDKHFGYDRNGLLGQLKLLFHGVNECSKKNLDDKWIEHSVEKILNYRQLCGYRDAANSFLKLKDLLKLSKGDFSDVERISKEVNMTLTLTCQLYIWRNQILPVLTGTCSCHAGEASVT